MKYSDTKIYQTFEKDWVMQPLESINFKRNVLKILADSATARLSKYFKMQITEQLLSLIDLECKLKKINTYNKNELINLTFDLYLFFGACLRNEATNNGNSLNWIYFVKSTSPDRMSDTYNYSLYGFRGKYLGRDPNLFYLVDELITQLTNGTYTNLLSAKFKELAPYTHKRAPKD